MFCTIVYDMAIDEGNAQINSFVCRDIQCFVQTLKCVIASSAWSNHHSSLQTPHDTSAGDFGAMCCQPDAQNHKMFAGSGTNRTQQSRLNMKAFCRGGTTQIQTPTFHLKITDTHNGSLTPHAPNTCH